MSEKMDADTHILLYVFLPFVWLTTLVRTLVFEWSLPSLYDLFLWSPLAALGALILLKIGIVCFVFFYSLLIAALDKRYAPLNHQHDKEG